MSLTPEFVASLLEDLYASPDCPDAWRRFLERLTGFCGCNLAFLLVADAAAQQYHRGAPPARNSGGQPHSGLPRPSRLLSVHGALAGLRSPHLAPPSILWDDTAGSLHPIAAAPHIAALHMAMGLALEPATKLAADIREDADQLLAILKPHLQRVARMQREALHSAGVQPGSATLGWFPPLFDIPVIGLDASGLVLEVSPSASRVLLRGGLQIRGSALAACVGSEEFALKQLLQAALVPGEATGARAMPAAPKPLPGPLPPRFAGAAMFSRGPLPPLSTVAVSLPPALPGAPVALLFLCDPFRPVSSRAVLLRMLYRLSPTEVRLVDRLTSGHKLKDAAIALHLTENTARFHLKEVFRKMSVGSQVDLLRFIHAMPGVGGAGEEAGVVSKPAAGLLSMADRRRPVAGAAWLPAQALRPAPAERLRA